MSGWQSVRVTRGIERLPSDFEIEMTELYPGEANAFVVQPGDDCRVKIGDDLVITGYVDRYSPSLSDRRHSIRISGRGKCADLVDCSAEWPSGQISGVTALGIAQKLASPYGITVSSANAEADGNPIPQFNVCWGETPFSIIERICRYRAFLAYDQPDGNLLLSRVGSMAHASGLTEGQNVESGHATYSQDQRFSDYVVRTLSTSVFSDAGGNQGDILAHTYDQGVKRHRLKYIIETGGSVQDLGKLRGEWEMARRFGRSAMLRIETDSWRDGGGKLWTPNQLVPVDLPSLRAGKKVWVISEVTYERGDRGTRAHLTIMPPEAFAPQPIVLQTTYADAAKLANRVPQ